MYDALATDQCPLPGTSSGKANGREQDYGSHGFGEQQGDCERHAEVRVITLLFKVKLMRLTFHCSCRRRNLPGIYFLTTLRDVGSSSITRQILTWKMNAQ